MKVLMSSITLFLNHNIIAFGNYSITILNVLFIVPIFLADIVIIKLFDRFTKKRELQVKNYYKVVSVVYKGVVHFFAFIGTILILGVKLDNLFDFLSAVFKFKIFTIAGTAISLITILIMVILVYVADKISKIVQTYFNERVFPRFKIDIGVRSSLSKLIGYSIIVIGVLIALQGVGIKLSAITVFAGVLGIGIGFGIQNITADFVSGIAILFERPIKEGDMVILKDTIGEVKRIRLRATVIKTIYNEHLIVPNSEFIHSIVENLSFDDLKLRISVKVGVAYSSDPFIVKQALIDAAKDTEDVLDYPEPIVYLKEFASSSINFELLAWIDNPQKKFQTTSDLHFSVIDKFRERNIVIPFPQTDVWIRERPENSN